VARRRHLRSWSADPDPLEAFRNARKAWCKAACDLLAASSTDPEAWKAAAVQCRAALDEWEALMLPPDDPAQASAPSFDAIAPGYGRRTPGEPNKDR
jgi:hypothetical protein